MIIKKVHILFFPVLFLLAFLISCNNGTIYSENKLIKNEKWSSKDTLKFQFQVEDTLSAYEFLVNIRNTTDYKYSNFFMFIHILFPDKKRRADDTLECVLADGLGKWLGKGHGKIRDNRIVYRKNILFPRKGIYKVLMIHGMREENIMGISDVGFMVKKQERR